MSDTVAAPAPAPAPTPASAPAPLPLFDYFDGVRTVFADPYAVYRQLLIRTRGKPNELREKIWSVAPDTTDLDKLQEAWDAAEQLLALIRELFAMQPFVPATGAGAREEHCWLVWDKFCAEIGAEKKSSATSPTSSSPTAASPPPA